MNKKAMIKVLRYKAEHIKTKIKPEFFAEVADMLEREPCEDTISRADAIRVASGYCHPSNIAKELAKLPPVTPKQRWIPVSERLPEALQTVLVTSKGGYVYTSCIAHGDWEYGGEVIAWQPLPKAYREVAE
jgi:hypothetical protein